MPEKVRRTTLSDPETGASMIKTGAVPFFLLNLVMAAGVSSALAAPNPSQPSTSPKPAAATKATVSADPFEHPATQKAAAPAAGPQASTAPAKPAATPPATAPAKPAATPPAPAPPNLPSKELEAFMQGFEGKWKCETKFPAGSMGPGSLPMTAKTDIAIKKEFDGFSWHGEFKLAKTITTSATSGMFQIGYAAGAKQATFLSYDSVGSAMMGAGALAGDAVTFNEEGFLKGAKVRVRETLAKKGPRKIHHKFEVEQGKSYQLMAEDSCTK
jgi:hypothetical protein